MSRVITDRKKLEQLIVNPALLGDRSFIYKVAEPVAQIMRKPVERLAGDVEVVVDNRQSEMIYIAIIILVLILVMYKK